MHHILSIKVKLHSWTRKTLKSNLSLGFQFYLSLLLALPQLVITLLVSSACLGYLLCILLVAGCSVVSDCFATPWIIGPQAPLSMGFPRQGYRNGLPFPSPGDPPYPGIKSMSSALAARFSAARPPGKLISSYT